MNIEARITQALKLHGEEAKRLRQEYTRRFDNVSVNQFGEANGDEIVAINQWYDKETKRMDKQFADTIKALAKG